MEFFNNLLLLSNFWLLLWLIYIIIFNIILNKDLLRFVIIKLPKWSKCYNIPITINNNYQCYESDIDIYSVMHVLIWMTAGIFFPNMYITAISITILFEFFEYFVGFRARWWQDLVANMIGYTIGNLLLRNMIVSKNKKLILGYFNNINIIYSFIILVILLLLISICSFVYHRKKVQNGENYSNLIIT